MSSFEELYKGYAPYFKEEKQVDDFTKEITLMPSTIETIDMARRSVHNEGSTILSERLKEKVDMDEKTARRLFTLLCVLHLR